MNISEKLYSLRKQKGLSQEQLAEKLNVSRQAVSKWESGVSVPESEKLIAISNFFGVSVDYLIKDDIEPPQDSLSTVPANRTDVVYKYIGLSLCVLGFICLMLWGVMLAVGSGVSDRIAASSAITVDGIGILLVICLVLLAVGTVLLLKKHDKR
ncbi:MAG: helix-turn-helix transcriptional regulator [Clostridia bacterium]|nr:helix-turn-helix transcriptional regulator [Clostridia bacterium]